MDQVPICAVARMYNRQNMYIGYILFLQPKSAEEVIVRVNLNNVPEGAHGIHIHEYGDMSGGCETMGKHFNPFGTTHGGRTGINRHPGDMGNIWSNEYYQVREEFTVPMYLVGPYYNLLGRGVVLHDGTDDLGMGNNEESLKTGNSGGRYACGVLVSCYVYESNGPRIHPLSNESIRNSA